MSSVLTRPPEDKYAAIAELQNLQLDVSFTIGAESGNTINVAVQIKQDRTGTAITSRRVLDVYFADANTGAAIIGTAPSGGAAIGTNGAILASIVANKMYRIVSNASGQFDLTITEAGAKTLYMVVVMPNGRLVVSGAITFV